jgi:uncharacterized membrane protein YedE/YeeE
MKMDTVREQKQESGIRCRSLAAAAVFGLLFGFLLQKGGVTQFNVLIGVLLLEDFTVAKVMLSAIFVGMTGIYFLNRSGKVDLLIKPTRLGSQILGGLIFGVGFGLLAYCPGTGAAALGQGSWDALFGFVGLILGSYLYAEFSERLGQSVETWGDMGEITIPQCLHARQGWVVTCAALVMLSLLVILEWFSVR